MVNAVKNLTRMGTDVRQIAKLLQAKAPPGHKLAYISEEEAQLLKRRGGSGRITESGVPSYEDTYYSEPTSQQGLQPVETTPTPAPAPAPDISSAPSAPSSDAEAQPGGFYGQGSTSPAGYGGSDTTLGTPPQESGSYQGTGLSTVPSITPADQGLVNLGAAQAPLSEASYTAPEGQTKYQELPTPGAPSKGFSNDTLAKLGLGAFQSALAAQQTRKAQAQGQQAKTEELALAAPYQQQGQQLQSLAQQGQLTPANQQILQSARAQLQQGVANRGGVGVQQASGQLANITQSLLQNQMNLGLQLQQIGDKIAIGAIQAGVQADQYVNQLTAAYANNIGRTIGGIVGIPAQTTTTTTFQ